MAFLDSLILILTLIAVPIVPAASYALSKHFFHAISEWRTRRKLRSICEPHLHPAVDELLNKLEVLREMEEDVNPRTVGRIEKKTSMLLGKILTSHSTQLEAIAEMEGIDLSSTQEHVSDQSSAAKISSNYPIVTEEQTTSSYSKQIENKDITSRERPNDIDGFIRHLRELGDAVDRSSKHHESTDQGVEMGKHLNSVESKPARNETGKREELHTWARKVLKDN